MKEMAKAMEVVVRREMKGGKYWEEFPDAGARVQKRACRQ